MRPPRLLTSWRLLLALLLTLASPVLAEGDELQEQVHATVERVMPAVVQLHAGGGLLGTGFLVSDSLVVTNNHVIQGFEQESIGLLIHDGRITTARVLHHEDHPDLAVLEIEERLTPAPRALKFAEMSKVRPGTLVLAVGHPGGLEYSVSLGILSAVGRPGEGVAEYFLQSDAAINGGNSGGPLINLKGEVVGIATSKLVRVAGQQMDGISFALAGTLAEHAVRDLQQYGRVLRADFGLTGLAEVTGLKAREHGVALGSLLLQVAPSGPAHQAGVRDEDILTEIDGQPIKGVHGFWLKLLGYEVGSTVKLSIVRGGERLEYTLPLMPLDAASAWSNMGADFSQDLKVLLVQPASPFALAGLQPGDTLVRIRGKSKKALRDITSLAELKQAVFQSSLKKEPLVLVVKRQGKQVELSPADLTALRARP